MGCLVYCIQDDLKALQERDPEFYNYLQQTDSGLLDFALDDTDEEEPEPSPSQEVHLTRRCVWRLMCSQIHLLIVDVVAACVG